MTDVYWFEVHSRDRRALGYFLEQVREKVNPVCITKWVRDVPENGNRMGFVAIETPFHSIHFQVTTLAYDDKFMKTFSFQGHSVMLHLNYPARPQQPVGQGRPERPRLERSRSEPPRLEPSSYPDSLNPIIEAEPMPKLVAYNKPLEVNEACRGTEETAQQGSQDDAKPGPSRQKRRGPTDSTPETSTKRPRYNNDTFTTTLPFRPRVESSSPHTLTTLRPGPSHPRLRQLARKRRSSTGSVEFQYRERRHGNDKDSRNTHPLLPFNNNSAPGGSRDVPQLAPKDNPPSNLLAAAARENRVCYKCNRADTTWSARVLEWGHVFYRPVIVCPWCALEPKYFREVIVIYRGPMVSLWFLLRCHVLSPSFSVRS